MSEFWQQKAREYAERQKQQSANLNPSDEKLREMIAEKDGQIAQLRKISQGYSSQIWEKDAEIARLKTTDWAGVTETLTKKLVEKDQEIARLKAIIGEGVEQEKANADRHRKQSVPLMVAIAEKDQEIARLKKESLSWAELRQKLEAINEVGKATEAAGFRDGYELCRSRMEKDAERYQKLRQMLSPNNPGRFDENIDSADEGSVKTEYYDPNYVSRSELARLLVHPLIEVANKDAERYRKLKASEYFERVQVKANEHCWQFVLFDSNPNFDAAVDALPEVKS